MFLVSPSRNQKPAGFQSNSNEFRQQFIAFILRSLGYDVLLNNFRDHCYSVPWSSTNLRLEMTWYQDINHVTVPWCSSNLLWYDNHSFGCRSIMNQTSSFSDSIRDPIRWLRGQYAKMTYQRVRPNIKPEPAFPSNLPQTWEHSISLSCSWRHGILQPPGQRWRVCFFWQTFFSSFSKLFKTLLILQLVEQQQ